MHPDRRAVLAGLGALGMTAASPVFAMRGDPVNIEIRKSDARGHAEHGWLDSRHTFSFADYHDPEHMGFGPLRVINEDRVEPARGFGTHPHRDMEIISYVVDGALAHRDTLGTGSVIRPGEVQLMSAGSGIHHSEMNPSGDSPVHFLQIWIVPEKRGGQPRYDQRKFAPDPKQPIQLVVSPDGADGSLTIGQDARIYRALLEAGAAVDHPVAPGRRAWVQVVRGRLAIDGVVLDAGDGAAITGADGLPIEALEAAEALVFDLP